LSEEINAQREEKKKTKKTLQKSEQKYYQMINNPLVGVYQSNLKGDFLYANQALANILEYESPEELLYVDVVTIYKNPELRSIFIEEIKKTGQINTFELELRTKRGKTKNVLVSGIFDGELISGMIMDITEHKQAEKRLHLLSSTVEQSTEGIAVADLKGNLLFVNNAFATLHGYTSEELVGKHLSIFHTAEQMPSVEAANQQIQKMGEFSGEIWHVRRDGTVFPTLMHNSLLQDEADNPIGMIGTLRDISERKQLEEEKKKIEAQLIQAQKMEAIGKLAGGVAHDFNNILQTIIGYSDFVLTEISKNHPFYNDIKEINQAGHKASALTRQLLTFSRRQIAEMKAVDLNTIVRNLEKMLRRLIGEDIHLKTVLDSKLEQVKADSSHMEQALINIAINARDAMPKGGRLTITTKNTFIDEAYCKTNPQACSGMFVTLSISDEGTGMDKEIMQHIFEPFFSTKKIDEGAGLGLSIVYGIIKQHNGWVNVYSEPGEGTVFRIYLPVLSQPVIEKNQKMIPLKEFHGQGERILLVEDEAGIRQFVLKALTKKGYQVFIAGTAQEALEVFKKEQGQFDLLFSDVILPDKNGLQLTAEFLARKPGLRILLTSGYPDQKSHATLINEKGYKFLQKPYTLNSLLKTIREVIES